MIFQQLYNISDIIIVGRLIGVNALAAVGASAPVYFVLLLITLGFTGGLTVITAQEFGAKNEAGVRKSVVHSLVASMVLSLLMTIVMQLYMTPLLQIMNVPQEILPEAVLFIRVLCGGLVLIVGYNLLFLFYAGSGRQPDSFVFFNFFFDFEHSAQPAFYICFQARRRRIGIGDDCGHFGFCCGLHFLYRQKISDFAFDAQRLEA